MTQWYRKPHSRQEYQVGFTTPAFVGDAEQQAAWRTPPFKALLRQFWRIRVAKSLQLDVDQLRSREHDLFGGVHGEEGQRSQVMLRLDDWGRVADVKAGEKFALGNVADSNGKNPGDAAVYLGYGPIDQTTKAVARSALLKGASRLSVLAPTSQMPLLEETMQLAAWFGTLGSRSRNGWGSLAIEGEHIAPIDSTENRALLKQIQSPLLECLKHDWPHALGQDERGALLWRTDKSFNDWKEAMLALAKLRRALRGHFSWDGVGGIGERHILAYPATKHDVSSWGREARVPNQIRLKVSRAGDGKLFGVIAHFPHKLPLPADAGLQERVWRKAHAFLDRNAQPFSGNRD